MAQSEVSTSKAGNEIIEKEYAGVRISLENCLFPPEAFQETPSHKDGLDKMAETSLRRIGCEFIQIAGIMLKVPQVAMATAQVLFQRFFFSKSFVRHKMEEIAMACIWLASKVEECPRRVRDVVNIFHFLRLQRKKLPTTPMVLDHEYITLKNNVIKAERRILKELGFCVHVKHPHKIIVVYLQVLELEKNRELVQTAWNYMNDSLQTTVFVQFPPETIACACIYLAARVLQIPLPNRPNWFYLFNATEEDIQKICVTLLCVYQTVKTPYELLEKMVEGCKDVIQQEKMKAKGIVVPPDDISAANSPSSKQTRPSFDSPVKDRKSENTQRSSTVPANRDGSSATTKADRKREEIRRSYDSGLKRSRTRSMSRSHSKKYRKQSSESSSSPEKSSPDRTDDRKFGRSDKLPKSYSRPNSYRRSDEKKRRKKRQDGKSRISKRRRRNERDGQKSVESPQNKKYDKSNKKHKRKHSPDASPISKPLSHVNGDKASSGRRHRSHRDSQKMRRSHSSNHGSKR